MKRMQVEVEKAGGYLKKKKSKQKLGELTAATARLPGGSHLWLHIDNLCCHPSVLLRFLFLIALMLIMNLMMSTVKVIFCL